MHKISISLVILSILIISCRNKVEKPVTESGDMENKQEIKQDNPAVLPDTIQKKAVFRIKSPAFDAEGIIPKKYACDGDNFSPPLEWSGAPAGVKSYAIVTEDPDAPAKIWTHWVVYNIPADINKMPEHTPKDKKLPSGALQGINDDQNTGYDGPCPPSGMHRYFFKLYALDKMLDISGDATKEKLMDEMKGHILIEAELMGRYSKQ